ncbi:glycine betaine/L-proline ABC transporter ATP-binding protein [Nesterenkonia sp. E16_7]|uniref:quaternary amine ABC transporter ATP-binding protein n=1 Tax=unclassified Nesterenkonia TaxID=2629769 RepID=UPI001A9264F4|nr:MULTISPECIES: glycine betaine/L-proline ABC transporter ATP-binding protein [unclassified Nesterenkonia]MBO0594078.1 glycine betaine/L-proline ABC transporter ATP-binding protein [Nesterenkonia sp. E16_10]MBO0597524.1 glycine betaine/L-proline ABC transporter ATP-binding protein [Nesterenkonia sp. E16_7]
MNSSTTEPVVRARNVFKAFGKRPDEIVRRIKDGADREDVKDLGTAAVIDASFDVQPGEVFVVMGLSGSGKSTLIRMVNGLLPATSGSIEVGGEDIARLSAKELRRVRREKVSMVFQHFALLPHRTVGQNAAYALEVQGLNRSDRERKAEEALQMVGLDGWGGSMPDELSGGMRQRVGLARALAAGTDVMLMDEAFSALDPLIRREMQDQLVELQEQLGKTILFITHDLNEAMRLGDRIAMMRDGRTVQIGTSEQILNDPANDYVAQFVQDVDRTRVLTAGAIMEPPVAVLGTEQGPRTAHKLMREHQTNVLAVVDRGKKLHGFVHEAAVAAAVAQGTNTLEGLLQPAPSVHAETPLAELMTQAAQSEAGLAVIDDAGRLEGIIARVTLLNALAEPKHTTHDTPEAVTAP